ncbi:MAG: hypothetical protein JXM69_06610 [Anaerolineae bacterium]|nr:hypothetical protein [Anaerolineae bacterium]
MPAQPNADRPAPPTEHRPPPARAKRRPPPARPARPFFMQRLRRQDLILLTGVLSLACFSVITVGLLLLRYQQSLASPTAANPASIPEPQATHTVAFVQITGLGQYSPVEAEARAWAGDAQLVAAHANWPQVFYQDQLGQPGQWTYRFYSPERQRLLLVKIEPDGRTRAFEHRETVTLPPDTLDSTAWSIDSPAALARWLDGGGAALIERNPGLEVLIQLRSLSRYPHPVWMVTGSDKRTQDILVVVIDASDGQMVPTTPSR